MSEILTQPVFEIELPDSPMSKGEREYQAFLRLLPDLLKSHQGQYVAIHDGEVVGTDSNDIALIQRVHALVGYVPIHVGLVTSMQPVARIPIYREYRRGE